MRVLPYQSLLILCAALGLCAGCGVRGPLSAPASSRVVAPVPQGAAVLVGPDGKTVQVAPAQPSLEPTKPAAPALSK